MRVKPGDAVWALVPFEEDHGAVKERPAIVLAARKVGDIMMYLVVGKYSRTNRVRDGVEMILDAHASETLGFDHREGVLRFGQHLFAVREDCILAKTGNIDSLSALQPNVKEAIRRCARQVGIHL